MSAMRRLNSNLLFPYYLPIFLSWPSSPCCEVRNQGYHTSPLRLDNVARQYPLLSCILLLVPRRIWPFVMAVALLVFGVYDLRLGLSLRTILFFQLPDAIETLTAAFGLRYAFGAIMGLGSTSPSIKIPTSRSTLQGFNRLAQIHLALRVRLQFAASPSRKHSI